MYKQIETFWQIAPAVTGGVLSGINATYGNIGNFGKVTIAVSTAVPIAGEGLYHVFVSTESGIRKTVKMTGSVILSLLGKNLFVTKKFLQSWSAEMLKQHKQNLADVELVATVLRATEGVGYSQLVNAFVDKYGGDWEKFIENEGAGYGFE